MFASWWDSYAIEVNCGNRNCYNYERFGHLAWNCRNRGTGGRIGKNRRLEYRNNGQRKMIEGGNKSSNLNGNIDLIVLN